MKYTCIFRSRNTIQRTVALAAACCSLQAFANPFNDGTTNAIVSDTAYNDTLYLGIQTPDNTLIIGSNAVVKADDVLVGQLTSSSNNVLDIMTGSMLKVGNADTNGVSGGLVVGDDGGNAAVAVNNASTVKAEALHVGNGSDDRGTVALAGEGTGMDISGDVNIGAAGSTNKVTISDGAALNVGGTLNVGSSSSDANYVKVNSGGTLFVNSTNDIVVTGQDDNGITVSGGTLQVGGDVDTGTIDGLGVQLSNKANLEVGGELTLEKNKINDGNLNVILNNDLSANTAQWVSSGVTIIGGNTSYNTLTLTNGAVGRTKEILQIGQEQSARNNELTIGGAGTLFQADSDILVGAAGRNNALNIGDGAQVFATKTLVLGNNATATGNGVNVGSNGTLTVSQELVVGDLGGNSELNVAHGTLNANSNVILGRNSSNNTLTMSGATTNTVTGELILGQSAGANGNTYQDIENVANIGEGSVLNLQTNLTVGKAGGGNIMNIKDGGTVNLDGDAIIGEASGDNYIFLMPDNADSQFNVTSDLIVGKEGGDNRFSIYGGVTEVAGNVLVGASTNQFDQKNYIHLETTNAVLNVANTVEIGAGNSGNTFDVVLGAEANMQDLLVGSHEGVSNNVVTIRGANNYGDFVEGSLISVSNNLAIGSETGTGNNVSVEDGGILYVASQSNIEIKGTNNTLTVAEGGTLKSTDWNFAETANGLTNVVLEGGSTLHLLGLMTGTNMVEGGLNVVLDGTGSSWDTGTNALYVGNETAGNSLTITNGAMAATSTNLYIGYASDNNELNVGGTNSTLSVGKDLYIGMDSDASYQNQLQVLDGASVAVGGDAYLYAARLKVDSSSQVDVAGAYSQDSGSRLEVGVSSNQVAPNLVVGGNAEFDTGSSIYVYDDGVSESNVINIVKAGSMTIGGETATTGLLWNNIETNLLLGFNINVSNGVGNTYIVVDDFIKRSLGEAAGLEGQLAGVADDVAVLAADGDEQAQDMLKTLGGMTADEAQQTMDDYYGQKSSSSPANNLINMGVQSVAEQMTLRADSTRSRIGAMSASAPTAPAEGTPEGAQGPHIAGQELQGWITAYGTWGSKDATDGFKGYDADISGFMIGADASVAESILVGIAGGSGRGSADQTGEASTDTKTIYGAVYASTGTKDWFADASVIYGSSSVDSTLGSAFDTKAEYDASNVALYFGGGKEIITKYLIYTPQASLLGNYYSQDGYTETSTTAVGREVDSFDTFYLQSSLGGSIAYYTALGNVTIKPEVRAFWLHEWNAKEEDLNYNLNGSANNYLISLQAPEEDILKLGLGASAKLGQYLELRADLDTRLGKDYSDYTLLGSLRYQF